MTSRIPTSITGFLAISCLLLFLAAAILALDPVSSREEPTRGIIVSNIMQISEQEMHKREVRVRLQDGLVVTAEILPVGGHPYKEGTQVKVIPYKTFLLGKRTYQAYIDQESGP